MIKCPNCSAELKFDAGIQKVHCDYCGSDFNADELKEEVKAVEEVKTKEEPEGYEGNTFLCSQCGAKVMTFDDTAVTFCSYCGSQAMIKKEMEKINPEYIIPFKITKEQCIASYKKKVKKFIFSPKYLSQDTIADKFRGIYMPYAVFKVGCHGDTKNRGSVYYKTVGNYQYYHDYEIKSHVDAEYDGISYDLVSKYSDKYSQAVRHNFNEAQPFNINYTSGFYVDTKDVSSKIYGGDAISEVTWDANSTLSKVPIYRKHGCHNPSVPIAVLEEKNALFPVYFMSFVDKDKKHIHYAVVNAQTGEVTFEIPVSPLKYLIFSAILSVILFVLLQISQITLHPRASLLIVVLLSIISLIIICMNLSKLKKQETYKDDKGMAGTQLEVEKQSFLTKFGFIIKPVIAMGICALAVIVDTPEDFFYYGVSAVGFILTIISYVDLLRLHNKLCMRKIPQLDKRGGLKE